MHLRPLLGRELILASLLALASCRSTHPFHEGIVVRNYLDTEHSEVTPAWFKAEFVMYNRPSLQEEGQEVLFRHLVVGDPLGFSREGDELFAVAGEERIQLERGLYCWHMRPGTGPSKLEYKLRSLTTLGLGLFALSLVSLAAISVGSFTPL